MAPAHEGSVGKAYGFFYYAGKDKISDAWLDYCKKETETPSGLTLKLVEGVENLNTEGDPELDEIVQEAKAQRMTHALTATLPGTGNQRTANYLGNIMASLYTQVYDKSEPFFSGIVYQRGEHYVCRKNKPLMP